MHDSVPLEGSVDSISVEDILKILEKMRAKDVKVVNVTEKCGWTDWMVVATGTSTRHLRGIAESITFEVLSLRVKVYLN